jgi:hypothetical protein
MPDYWVEPYEPDDLLIFEGLQVRLNKTLAQRSSAVAADAQAVVSATVAASPLAA